MKSLMTSALSFGLLLGSFNSAVASECIDLYESKVKKASNLLQDDTKIANGVLIGGSAVGGLIATIAGAPYVAAYLGGSAVFNLAKYGLDSGSAEEEYNKNYNLLAIIDERQDGHKDMKALLEAAVGVNGECRPRFEDTLLSLKQNICTQFTKEKRTLRKDAEDVYESKGRYWRRVVDETPELDVVVNHIVDQSQCHEGDVNGSEIIQDNAIEDSKEDQGTKTIQS